MTSITGLWVPIVTPFDQDDRVDAVALGRLASRLLRDGATGLVALGTTGEPAVLSTEERRLVAETVAEVCAAEKTPLIIGCGTNSTSRTVEAVNAMADLADAVLVVSPYYTRPSGRAIVEHFRVVAAESPVPVVAYNVPYRTGRGLDGHELLAIASIPNVAGLKQAVGALDADTLTVLRDAPASFAVLAGDDAFIGPTILMGGAGAIAASAHLCTSLFAELVSAATAGDAPATRHLAGRLLPVVHAGFAEPSPAAWKGALHRLAELETASLRPPMTPATEIGVDALLDAARTADAHGFPP